MFEAIKSGFSSLFSSSPKDGGEMVKGSRVAGGQLSFIQAGEPPKRGTRQLMEAYTTMPWLRAVTHRIAESVASTTWVLYYAKDLNGNATRAKKIQRMRDHKARHKSRRLLGSSMAEVYDHPFLDLLENGNHYLDGHACLEMIQVYMDLKGESFSLIMRNEMGMPVSLWPLPPHWVMEVPGEDKAYFKVSIRNVHRDIPEKDILWIKDPDPVNPYGRGSGIAESLADELDTDEYAAQFLKSFFYNSAMPSAIVSIPNADPSQVERVSQIWNDQHRGAQKGHRTKFINYETKVNTFGQAFQDRDVVELRKYERDIVQQVYGVPPEVIGIVTNSNRATISAADTIYSQWVLVPRLERIRSALQKKLVPFFDDRLILDFESPIPEDREFQLRVIQTHAWAFERAEIRALAGFKSHGESDEVYLMPMNLYEKPVGSADIEDVDTPQDPEDPGNPEDGEGFSEVEGPQKAKLLVGKSSISVEDIRGIVDSVDLGAKDPQLDEMSKLWASRVESRGQQEVGLLVDETGMPSSGFSMDSVAVQEHLRDFSENRIKGIVDKTTKRELERVLSDGLANKISNREMRENIRGVFEEARTVRARAVAETEVVRSSNFGTTEAFDQTGLATSRMWVTIMDGRARHQHEGLHGVVKPVGEPFEAMGRNGGVYRTMYPGNFGTADLDVNCRCSVVMTTSKEARVSEIPDSANEQVASLERARRRWERNAQTMIKRRFDQQEREVLRAYRSIGVGTNG